MTAPNVRRIGAVGKSPVSVARHGEGASLDIGSFCSLGASIKIVTYRG